MSKEIEQAVDKKIERLLINLSNEAQDEMRQISRYAINNFYSNYQPKKYVRTNYMKSKDRYDNFDYIFAGGRKAELVQTLDSGDEPYIGSISGAWTPAEEVFKTVWLEGSHGHWTSDPISPRDQILEDIKTEDFKRTIVFRALQSLK